VGLGFAFWALALCAPLAHAISAADVRAPRGVQAEERRERYTSRRTPHRFTAAYLEKLVGQLKKQQIPLPQITVTDNGQPGSGALIRGLSRLVHDRRDAAVFEIGQLGDRSIDEARKLARIVQALAQEGVDP
jgi:hypothetical protein